MSVLSLRLPDSIHQKARQLAEREDISLNQFIALAVAEKMSALLTEEFLEERARRGNREKFAAILARVPDAPPLAGDELPESESMARGAHGKGRLKRQQLSKPGSRRRSR